MSIPWPDLLLAILGALIGIVATLVSDELKGWLGWSGFSNRDLRGRWDCEWQVEWPTNTLHETIRDTVVIQRAGRRDVFVTGIDVHGSSYNMRGAVSQANVFALTFDSAKSKNLSGIALLRLDVMRRQLAGHWLQLDPSGTIVGGRATWRRLPGR